MARMFTVIFSAGALLLLNACATGGSERQDTWDDPNAATAAEPAPAPEPAGEVYYVSTAGLKLYPQPSMSGVPLAILPLNEKVTRYKLEDGFAFVTVEYSGKQGWLDNAQLDWRKIETEEPGVPAEPVTHTPVNVTIE